MKEKELISIKDGENIIETVYVPESNTTQYVVGSGNEISEQDSYTWRDIEYKPLSVSSQELQAGVLKLPSGYQEYGSQVELVQEVQKFIHDYVDVSESFEIISAYYVLMTWVSDRFQDVPYLRVRGNPGCGKSTFLKVISELCYKATVMNTDPSESTLYRTMDKVRGTLFVDEADFYRSSKTSGMVKILNNGVSQGGVVSRSRSTKDGSYDTEYFQVFGPKVLANRSMFQDDALESRCITEYMIGENVRPEVLVSRGREFCNRALELRNKLLKYRLDNFHNTVPVDSKSINSKLNNRSRQIGVALVTLMEPDHLSHLDKVLMQTEEKLNTIRDNSLEVDITKVLLIGIEKKRSYLTVGEIAGMLDRLNTLHERVTPRKVGSVLSNLEITRQRGGASGATRVSLANNERQINYLKKYYQITEEELHIDTDDWSDITEQSECTERVARNIEVPDEYNPFDNKK